ncbi:MAG: 1-(5-phosphoribosyl)-5-[(5-phosphoribosylamino)methylideneamino]imidazole-4-carboxamide isomerase [Candidatus Xiphinematobacter sp.]|nr:MAG: 1-(5-phosphoribosyl)-5-[(5-phosphoribosylamino)methylideneamino]imidazole-4-carboxamide isomerase [Candidatus Xiphinematobacter sp.]
MLLLPAIDLMAGQVVRLKQGRATEKTVYSEDPPEVARQWEAIGGDWLHIVDLDAAFEGNPRNMASVRAICQAVTIPCELGGGMRSKSAIRAALEAGVSRVVLGTCASESLEFVREMCRAFGDERIAIGIDACNGLIATKGWTHRTSQHASDLALAIQEIGVSTIVYTDITADGMLQGPNFSGLSFLLSLLSCQLIASGGISSVEDLQRLNAMMPRPYGSIIGRALYDGRIKGDLRGALSPLGE